MKFKPEDFKPPYKVLVSVEMSHLETIAALANHRLAEMLAESPRVEFSQGMFQGGLVRDFSTMVDWELLGDPKGLFTARLVAIEKIGIKND